MNYVERETNYLMTLLIYYLGRVHAQKRDFPLRISLVNMVNTTETSGFGHIY